MNRRRLMFIGAVALALGGLLSSIVYRQLQKNTVAGHPLQVDVLIAANNIPAGKRIEDGDLKVVSYPADFLPPDALHTKKSAVGHGAALPIEKGEFVISFKLSAEAGLSGLFRPACGLRPCVSMTSYRSMDLSSPAHTWTCWSRSRPRSGTPCRL